MNKYLLPAAVFLVLGTSAAFAHITLEAQEAADLMRLAGFREVQVDHRDQEKWYDQIVVLGKR